MKLLKLLPFTAVGGFGYALFSGKIDKWQKSKIKKLEAKISMLKKEFVPLRFKILERSGGVIIVGVKFYYANGTPIKYKPKDGTYTESVRFEIKGNTIAFDNIIVPNGKSYLIFPERLFTDTIPPSKGINLTRFYQGKDFKPLIYSPYSQVFGSENATELNEIFKLVVEGKIEQIKGAFGSAVSDIAPMQFEVGSCYRLVLHVAKGGVEIIKEDVC